MANPTPLFNRVAFMVFLAGFLLLEMYAFEALPIAAIAFWILGFDGLRISVGWNWSRSAAKSTVGEEFKRLLKQDLAGWKVLGAAVAVLLFWFLQRTPIDLLQLVVFVLGFSLVSGALREWRLRSEAVAPKAKALQLILFLWAMFNAIPQKFHPLPAVDLYGFLFRYWLMLPLGVLGAYAMYQAVLHHPVRSEKFMDADD